MPIVIDVPHCLVCGQDYEDLVLMAGIRLGHTVDPSDRLKLLTPGKYVEGHYDCVLKSLTAEEALAAINSGQLPPAHEIAKVREAIRRAREAKGAG